MQCRIRYVDHRHCNLRCQRCTVKSWQYFSSPSLQIIEESEEFLKAVSPQDQEKGHFPLKQVRSRPIGQADWTGRHA